MLALLRKSGSDLGLTPIIFLKKTDSDDSGDTYMTHNNAGNSLSIVVDGAEVARFKP